MINLFILVSKLKGGGAERIAATLVEKLPNIYHQQLVQLYATDYSYYQLTKDKDISIDMHIPKNGISRYISHILLLFKYIKLIHHEKPKIVVSILDWENIINLLSSILTPVIPVISMHGEPIMYPAYTSPMLNGILSLECLLVRIIPKARFIAVSNGVKDQLNKLYHVPYRKIKVLYNPIDVESIQSLTKSVDYPSDLFSDNVPVIITAGRLNMVKGQHHLIRAFAMLRRDHPARLLICGIGPEETYLKTLANDLGVEKDVIFLGWQKNPYKYMAHSTVFVLSSLSESFGNVLVEAMASGCPVISANCSSGVREIIGENCEYGLLAESMTGIRHRYDESLDSGEKSLLESMLKLIDDSSLREYYIEKGKERAGFFSVERRIREYELFIQELMVQKD